MQSKFNGTWRDTAGHKVSVHAGSPPDVETASVTFCSVDASDEARDVYVSLKVYSPCFQKPYGVHGPPQSRLSLNNLDK